MRRVVVFITVPDRKTGLRIADRLVRAKLAACAGIMPGLRSVYWWKGRIESASELLLTLKTEARKVRKLAAEAKKLHPYEIPEIIALPITGGNPGYLRWISASVKGGK